MMSSDPSTRVLGRLRNTRIDIVRRICTLETGLYCKLWKIQLGRGVIFQGRPVLYRGPDTLLSIGDFTQLLSSRDSNLAGINRPCYLSTLHAKAELRLGQHCGLSGTVISAAISVVLGNHVLCGANTTILDTDFHHTDPTRRLDHRDVPAAPVVLEDNVWLGMGSTVLKGVRIGKNSVIAAGSVVVRSIPPNVIAGGVPARVLKPLPASLQSDKDQL